MSRMQMAIGFSIAALLALVVLAPAAAGQGPWPQDKGAKRVDVSSYPAAIRQGYKLLQEDCGACHSVARPLNTTMSPEQWRACATSAHTRLAGIPGKDVPRILDFLIYDQIHRKDQNPKAYFPPPVPIQIAIARAGGH